MTYCSQLRKDNLLYTLTKSDSGFSVRLSAFRHDIDDPAIMSSSVLYLPTENVVVSAKCGFYQFDTATPDTIPLTKVVDDDLELFIWNDRLVHVQYECSLDLELEDDDNISRDMARDLEKNEWLFTG